jgi:ribulose 1,5-bisphosphate carboxylase large subunit-like protein
MNIITYSQIHELVMRLPAEKLSLAYNLLIDLTKKKDDEILTQSDFMNLPLNERRRIMAQQAREIIFHYERESGERQSWQAGDFADEY